MMVYQVLIAKEALRGNHTHNTDNKTKEDHRTRIGMKITTLTTNIKARAIIRICNNISNSIHILTTSNTIKFQIRTSVSTLPGIFAMIQTEAAEAVGEELDHEVLEMVEIEMSGVVDRSKTQNTIPIKVQLSVDGKLVRISMTIGSSSSHIMAEKHFILLILLILTTLTIKIITQTMADILMTKKGTGSMILTHRLIHLVLELSHLV